MKKSAFSLLLAFSILSTPLHAEFRSWANSEGVSIDAEFVKTEGDQVTLRLRNGKLTTFPLSKLSDGDQSFIKESKPATAQPETKPAVAADRKAKWLTKMEKAQEQATETGLPILVLFTGTTWCSYCIKLEKEVFSKPEFKTFADQNLVLLILDYGPGGEPSSKKDEKLAKDYGVTGYPTYFLIDATGKQLAKGGFHDGITPAKFSAWAKAAAPKTAAAP